MQSPATIAKSQRSDQKLRLLISGLSIIYVAGLVYIFFFARRRWGPFPKRNVHLDPFGEKIAFWQSAGLHTRPETIEFYKDLLGNILLFVPFPFLLLFVFRIKGFTRLLLSAMLVSIGVEVLQYIFNIGVADIDDLILNTI